MNCATNLHYCLKSIKKLGLLVGVLESFGREVMGFSNLGSEC